MCLSSSLSLVLICFSWRIMMSGYCFPILVLILLLWNSINSLTTIAFSDVNVAPDRLALLVFKEKINDDPLQALSSWNDSIHYCNWNGITCNCRHRDRVTVLDLQSNKLEGTLSPHIGNLSFLREIRLNTNYFHGPIPQEIGHLSRLEVLSLAHNSFDHKLPTNITHCSTLHLIDLENNQLSGGIPIELASLSKLNLLQLRTNELKGNIPSLLGNLSSLTALVNGDNGLTGNIPDDLCHIQSLKEFDVALNKLTGKVHSCLYNLSQIIGFSIAYNQLDGSLPSDIGLKLPNLQIFLAGRNKLKGLIPLSFPNASRLGMLHLPSNQFIGPVPRNLGMLQGLTELSLFSNQLLDDMQFITSLTNCTNLEELVVAINSLKGPLPNSIGNLSTKLTYLSLGGNQIYGSIPASIGNLVNLRQLSFANNHLTGDISKLIGVFPQMVKLYFYGNEFSGQIPDSFNHNSTQLTILSLYGNKLHGKIPPSLGNCQSLSQLDLSKNRLNGTIPKQLLHLPSLIVLDLFNNILSGPLPSEVGNLTNLMHLDLSGNKFLGSISTTLGNILTLEYLSISQNLFTGNIPQSLSALKGLQELNFSRNKLSGEIPPYLENFTYLIKLDLSYNDLEDSVPKVGVFVNATAVSVDENSKLCGGVVELKLPPCQNHKNAEKSQFFKVVVPVIVVSICLVVLLCLIFLCYRKRVLKEKPTSESLFINQFTRITYAELLKATNRFSIDNLIGIGSFGLVYKAIVSQSIVAVKVINLQQHGAVKSFLSECNALKNVRHRNLLKIITACSSVDFQGNDFKALVFEFMPNGSLEEWLHPKRNKQNELKNLNFLQRLNIAIDVAYALDYLHNHCQPAIVHCDLKPSNVLLDNDMTAHVADFGLAKIFSNNTYNSSQSQGSSLAIKGSIGYVAPEYGMGGEVSMQGDIYSYGILLLEFLTGKKPTDDMFQNDQNLHHFAKAALLEGVMTIVDPTMLESIDKAINIGNQSDQWIRVQKCLVSAIRLAVACSLESSVKHMKIGEVIPELHHIRDNYEGVRVHLK